MAGEAILVTGGAGYVGAQTCALLADAGYHPVVLDDLSRGHRDLVRWGPLEIGSVCEPAFVRTVIARHAPAVVVHLAGYAYVAESLAQPDLYQRNNVGGGLTLLEAMRETRHDKLVFSSSCTTYGDPREGLITEMTPQHPVHPYGAGKLAVEQAILAAGAASGLKPVILRYFNVAGADPQSRCGERHDPEPHVIPNAIYAAFDRIPAFSLHGDDFDTADGTCVRDFVHVVDIARAHVASVERLLGGGAPAVVNLANERGHSVREIIASVERVTGRTVPTRLQKRRPGDVASLVASAALAREQLGWRPQWPDIDSMVAHAVAWAKADRQVEAS
jgi:UDP-glucose-4-epimerase GalE